VFLPDVTEVATDAASQAVDGTQAGEDVAVTDASEE
jgi:hypothetical protein